MSGRLISVRQISWIQRLFRYKEKTAEVSHGPPPVTQRQVVTGLVAVCVCNANITERLRKSWIGAIWTFKTQTLGNKKHHEKNLIITLMGASWGNLLVVYIHEFRRPWVTLCVIFGRWRRHDPQSEDSCFDLCVWRRASPKLTDWQTTLRHHEANTHTFCLYVVCVVWRPNQHTHTHTSRHGRKTNTGSLSNTCIYVKYVLKNEKQAKSNSYPTRLLCFLSITSSFFIVDIFRSFLGFMWLVKQWGVVV